MAELLVKNAVNLTLRMSADSNDALRAKLSDLLTQFDIYGVRSFVSSDLGIVEIERREVTPEQYRREVIEAANRIKERRAAEERKE